MAQEAELERNKIYRLNLGKKAYTSFCLTKEFGVFRKPLWSPSKFISSVGAVTLDVVKKYIEDQQK